MALRKTTYWFVLAVTFGAMVMMTSTAWSAGQLDFSGKTITWVIPFTEGGGSSKLAAFYAPLLSEALPGKPPVVPKFMPGAGSTKGANWFQRQKYKDGTLIFNTSATTQFPYLLGDKRVRYEYKDWHIFLASGTGGVAYLPPDIAKKFDGTANKLKDINFIYGSQGATRLDLIPLLAWEMLGMKVQPVFGIKGRGDGRLMFERGEANIDYQTSPAYLKAVVPLVKEGKAVPMMTWGFQDEDGNIVRDPTFPEIPTFKEVCEATEGCETKGDAWEAWKAFFIAGFPAQKMMFLPKGASPEAIETWTNAARAVLNRPDFAKISELAIGKYPQMTGKAAQKALSSVFNVPESAKAYIKKWLFERYGVKL